MSADFNYWGTGSILVSLEPSRETEPLPVADK
jgi:hypothetical protein